MASDTPDIDPDEGGEIGEPAAADGAAAAALAAGGALCLSCGAGVVGPYCARCGQKNDDMRRSSLVLFKDFLTDTFAFDSRMWRTLGLIATAPGLVPTHYSHGKRSQYTPPVRLFLVVSFLFFLTLGLTRTMFVAVDVRAKTPEEIAADEVRREVSERLSDDTDAAGNIGRIEEKVLIERPAADCDIKVGTRFFVRPEDITVDQEKWRACSSSLSRAAQGEIAVAGGEMQATPIEQEKLLRGFVRVMGGLDRLIVEPAAFNQEINVWLPRVMFFMTPLLALVLALFIRGRDALLFDHLVLSLYGHAAGFAVIGVAIVAVQFGVPNIFPFAMAALGIYFIATLKRAYKRGWLKTVFAATFAGLAYIVILSAIVGMIIASQVWRASA